MLFHWCSDACTTFMLRFLRFTQDQIPQLNAFDARQKQQRPWLGVDADRIGKTTYCIVSGMGISLLITGCPCELNLDDPFISFDLCTRNYMKGMIHDHSTHDGVPPNQTIQTTTNMATYREETGVSSWSILYSRNVSFPRKACLYGFRTANGNHTHATAIQDAISPTIWVCFSLQGIEQAWQNTYDGRIGRTFQNCLLLGAAEATQDSLEKDRSCSGRHVWFKQEGNLLCSCSLPLLSWKILSFKMTTRQNIGKTAPTYLHRKTPAISEGCLCASLFECPRLDWKKWWGRGGGEGWCAVVFMASSWSSFELFMSWNGSVFHWWAAFASYISSFCKHAWRCSWNRRSSLLFL